MQSMFYVGFHCLFLDDGLGNSVVEADQRDGFLSAEGGSVSVYTGLAMGWVSVEVQQLHSAPGPSEPVDDQWTEVCALVVPRGGTSEFILHSTSSDVSDDIFLAKPASDCIGIRVHAWGRDLAFDEIEVETEERYLIQIWPVQ